MENRILAKENREFTMRFAPQLVIKKDDTGWAYTIIEKVIMNFN